ncbi:MAG: hypothetical protein HKK66_12660 [Chlorobiaceae bacterium]|nr:hypothetical protein [Chlorobiaceae bacterium]
MITLEEEIDLTAVHADLVNLEERIVQATSKHNEFLKELGLPPLPLANEG